VETFAPPVKLYTNITGEAVQPFAQTSYLPPSKRDMYDREAICDREGDVYDRYV